MLHQGVESGFEFCLIFYQVLTGSIGLCRGLWGLSKDTLPDFLDLPYFGEPARFFWRLIILKSRSGLRGINPKPQTLKP